MLSPLHLLIANSQHDCLIYNAPPAQASALETQALLRPAHEPIMAIPSPVFLFGANGPVSAELTVPPRPSSLQVIFICWSSEVELLSSAALPP